MNRGQVKRLRKEFERLRTGGREWDALRLLEKEDVVDGFRDEWNDLWRGQLRHALRTAALMEDFLLHVNGFSRVPDTADIRFMCMVGDYLDGKDVVSAINGMAGLSAPAEALRRELLRHGDERAPDDAKLRKLLTTFALTPESALQKEYRQLRSLLTSYPAISQETCETLEELLTRSRKLNSASAVKKTVNGIAEADLRGIDPALKKVASELPLPFFRVVAAPVLAQISIAIRRVAESSPDQGARLALAAPFCMESLAGPAWPGLREKFQLEAARALSEADLASLRKTAQSATFEERFTLINKVERLMSIQKGLDEDLQDILVLLYKGIFKELALRRAILSDRDKRRLAAVFGPVFSRHMELLCGDMKEMPFVLDSAAAAGCLDAVSALLHTFFAVMLRERAMIANARGMLRLLPPIQEKEVRDLFGEYQMLLSEDVNALKGMLDICRECGHDLDKFVSMGLRMSLLSTLVMNTLMAGGGRKSLMAMIMGPMSEESSWLCKKLIKGMECFAGNPEFSAVVGLARGFPSGRITGNEFRQLMEKQIEGSLSTEQSIDNFIIMLEMISKIDEAQEMGAPFGGIFEVDQLVREILIAGLDVLCGKRERAVRHSTDALGRLFGVILKYGDGCSLKRYLLLIGNAAYERMEAGDDTAGRLHAAAMDYISMHKRMGKKRGRRR